MHEDPWRNANPEDLTSGRVPAQVLPGASSPVLHASHKVAGIAFMRLQGSDSAFPTAVPGRNALSIVTSLSGTCEVTDGDIKPGYSSELSTGDVVVRDLRHPTALRHSEGAILMTCHVPIPTLRDFALRNGWRELPAFVASAASGMRDSSLSYLMASLAPYFDDIPEANAAVVDHVSLAILSHLLTAYFSQDVKHAPSRSGLAGWQERRAREIIDENLSGEISIAWLAKQFGLSSSHFARAFKDAVGVPPYQWVIERRVNLAKTLMRDRSISLADVAVRCGFADQSHFSRAFSRTTGTPPGVWRRAEDEAVTS